MNRSNYHDVLWVTVPDVAVVDLTVVVVLVGLGEVVVEVGLAVVVTLVGLGEVVVEVGLAVVGLEVVVVGLAVLLTVVPWGAKKMMKSIR